MGQKPIEGSNPSLSAIFDGVFLDSPWARKDNTHPQAPVAQLDRVPGYEPGGRRFESFRARHTNKKGAVARQSLFCLQVCWVRTSDETRMSVRPARVERAGTAAGRPAGQGRSPSNPSGRAIQTKKGLSQDSPFFVSQVYRFVTTLLWAWTAARRQQNVRGGLFEANRKHLLQRSFFAPRQHECILGKGGHTLRDGRLLDFLSIGAGIDQLGQLGGNGK